MDRLTSLQIALLTEKLKKITGKDFYLEFLTAPEILDTITKDAKVSQGITKLKNGDFELIFDFEGDTLDLTWINVKSTNVTGKDVLSALITLSRSKGAHKIKATGVRGKYHGKLAYGYYALLKWGFIPEGGIKFINDTLHTQYKSINEAFADPEFWNNWKANGVEFTGIYTIH